MHGRRNFSQILSKLIYFQVIPRSKSQTIDPDSPKKHFDQDPGHLSQGKIISREKSECRQESCVPESVCSDANTPVFRKRTKIKYSYKAKKLQEIFCLLGY